jgi:hypothetical protein
MSYKQPEQTKKSIVSDRFQIRLTYLLYPICHVVLFMANNRLPQPLSLTCGGSLSKRERICMNCLYESAACITWVQEMVSCSDRADAGLDLRSTLAKCQDGALWTTGLVVQVCMDAFYLFVALQACTSN